MNHYIWEPRHVERKLCIAATENIEKRRLGKRVVH